MLIPEKVYFAPGDLVKIRHKLDNVPLMIIEGKKYLMLKNPDKTTTQLLQGMTCYWFDKDNRLQTAVFSTKDLEHVK